MKRFSLLLPLLCLLTLPVRAAAPVVERSSVTELGGAEYREELWLFEDGECREIHSLVVDLSHSALLLATPGDDCDNDGGSGRGAALADMAQAAAEKGRHVLAAVNGDFYKTSADGGEEYALYAPLGVMVKEGTLLSEGQRAEGAAYFGITKDGRAVIGSAEPGGDWDSVKDSLLTAVGGELRLIRDGESNLASLRWRTDSPILAARYGQAGQVYDPDGEVWSVSGALSSYPRTAVGIRDDGCVLLVCASPGGVTPGLTVPQLTELLLTMGCREAMNLDGGPSTQMVVADGNGGFRQTVSGGVSRRIGVGLMAVEGRAEDFLVPPAEEAVPSSPAPILVLFLAVLAAAMPLLVLGKRKARVPKPHAHLK